METTAQVLSRCYNPLNSQDSKLIVERRRNDVYDVNCSMIKASHESFPLGVNLWSVKKYTQPSIYNLLGTFKNDVT